jgi:hypothetical protein
MLPNIYAGYKKTHHSEDIDAFRNVTQYNLV